MFAFSISISDAGIVKSHGCTRQIPYKMGEVSSLRAGIAYIVPACLVVQFEADPIWLVEM